MPGNTILLCVGAPSYAQENTPGAGSRSCSCPFCCWGISKRALTPEMLLANCTVTLDADFGTICVGSQERADFERGFKDAIVHCNSSRSCGRPQPWGVGSFSAHRASAPLWVLGPEITTGAPLSFSALEPIAGAVSRYLKNHRDVSKSQGRCEAYWYCICSYIASRARARARARAG
eukprot:COSAG06_NODE_2420_length_6905_cov_5.610344_1_plen_175_part_10